MEGRLAKIRSQKALLEQPYIKDTGSTVAEHIKSAVASLGENIQVCILCCHLLTSPAASHFRCLHVAVGTLPILLMYTSSVLMCDIWILTI